MPKTPTASAHRAHASSGGSAHGPQEFQTPGETGPVAEEEFLNLVFVHFETGWHLAREGRLLRLDAFACDVCAFLALPIPRAVWERTKSVREKRFVHFVEKALGQDQR